MENAILVGKSASNGHSATGGFAMEKAKVGVKAGVGKGSKDVKDAVETKWVMSGLGVGELGDKGAPVALWTRDAAHPEGEVFVAGLRPVEVGLTLEVERKLADGTLVEVEAPAVPTLSALSPNTAVLGSADVVMECQGSGFIEGWSVIVFNGYEEPTTFIDEGHITTGVKPSIFTVAEGLPVLVRTPGVGDSAALDFTFTAAA
jgi:hypothetical protein